jgi:hypothetical protein
LNICHAGYFPVQHTSLTCFCFASQSFWASANSNVFKSVKGRPVQTISTVYKWYIVRSPGSDKVQHALQEVIALSYSHNYTILYIVIPYVHSLLCISILISLSAVHLISKSLLKKWR